MPDVVIPTELRQEIKKEIWKQLAKYLVAAVIAAIGFVFFAVWFYIRTNLPDWVGTVPAGSVIAMDVQGGCGKVPGAWEEFTEGKGRVVVGVGKSSTTNASDHPFRQIAGDEKYTLAPKQMPLHSHEVPTVSSATFASNNNVNHYLAGDRQADTGVVRTGKTSETGGSDPYNVMPPFVVLFLCKKL